MFSKKGFSIAELLVVLAIIGIVISIVFSVYKPHRLLEEKNAKYKNLAVYNALHDAVYEIVQSKEDADNPFKADTPEAAATRLCNGLVSYINTLEDRCSTSPYMNDIYGYMATSSNINFKTMVTSQMTTQNGMKIYLSRMFTTADGLKYFIIHVDINALDHTNTSHMIMYDAAKKKHPDVFSYAAIPTGHVIPIGLLEYDIRYLPTYVKYRSGNNKVYSPAYSYRRAKNVAWGFYQTGNTADLYNEYVAETYNDKIRADLDSHFSCLYSFNYGSSPKYPETYAGGAISECQSPDGTQTYSCELAIERPKVSAR